MNDLSTAPSLKDDFNAGNIKSRLSSMTREDLEAFALRIWEEKEEDRISSMIDLRSGLFNAEYFEENGISLFAKYAKNYVDVQRPIYVEENSDTKNFTVVVVDINGLKKLNDEHGHLPGHELIAAASAKISNMFRDTDIVARVGGDEFGAIVQTGDVQTIADRLDALRGRITFPLNANEIVVAEFSYGISQYNGNQPSFQSMFSQADDAMYQQKQLKKAADITTKIIPKNRQISDTPADYIGLPATPSSSPRP